VDSKIGVNFINWPIDEVESLRINEQVQTGVKPDANVIESRWCYRELGVFDGLKHKRRKITL